jgi:hypothetical protein
LFIEPLPASELLKIALSPHSQPHFERSEKSGSSQNRRVAKNRFLVASHLGMRLGNFNGPSGLDEPQREFVGGNSPVTRR